MALPRLDIQQHNVVLPISKKTIKLQPYLAKHERMLLKAKEADTKQEVVSVITQIIQDCVLNIEIDALPMADIEFIMLKLKAISSGEVVEINLRCKNKVDGETCNHIVPINIDLDHEVHVVTKEQKDKIQLTDKIGIKLKAPSYNTVIGVFATEDEETQLFDIIASCIEYVWDENELYRDWTKDDIQQFLDSMSHAHIQQIKDFIDSLPSIEVTKDFKCTKCGYEEQIKLRNLTDFFM